MLGFQSYASIKGSGGVKVAEWYSAFLDWAHADGVTLVKDEGGYPNTYEATAKDLVAALDKDGYLQAVRAVILNHLKDDVVLKINTWDLS